MKAKLGWLAVIVGALLTALAIIGVSLDLTGRGDHAGLDPRDLATLVAGIVVLALGIWRVRVESRRGLDRAEGRAPP